MSGESTSAESTSAESTSADSRFDREAAERVLRRAIHLADAAERSSADDGLAEQALIEAAEELGLDAGAVRLAAAEERLGLLHDGHGGVLDRLAGPAEVTASALVESSAADTMAHADEWLRRHGSLRRRRHDPEALVATYTRRSDFAANVQRSVRSVLGREQLDKVRHLKLAVAAVDDDHSAIVLVGDLSTDRSATAAAGLSIAGIGSAFSVAGAFTGTGILWLGVPASIAAGFGVLRWRVAALADVRGALDGVLGRVVAADTEPGVISEVRDRLRSQWSRPAAR